MCEVTEEFTNHLQEMLENSGELVEELGILMSVDRVQSFKEATYLTNDEGLEVQVTMTDGDGEDVKKTFVLTVQEK